MLAVVFSILKWMFYQIKTSAEGATAWCWLMRRCSDTPITPPAYVHITGC